jgi:hypothetical protein
VPWLGLSQGFARAGINPAVLTLSALKALYCWVYDGTKVGYLLPATYYCPSPTTTPQLLLPATCYCPLPTTRYLDSSTNTNSLCCSQTVDLPGAPRRTELEAALHFVDGFGSRVSPGNVPARVCSTHPIPSHPIPSHPIPSHPIPSHPIPPHPIPSPVGSTRAVPRAIGGHRGAGHIGHHC